jgi:hypothetical protein
LDRLRAEIGWTPEKLANEMGVGPAILRDWTSGRKVPMKEKSIIAIQSGTRKMAKALGKNVDGPAPVEVKTTAVVNSGSMIDRLADLVVKEVGFKKLATLLPDDVLMTEVARRLVT